MFGNALHLLVASAEKSLKELPEFLASKGMPPAQMDRIAPSLEDVFVRLITADAEKRKEAA